MATSSLAMATLLMEEAKSFNTFGSGNSEGANFQSNLLAKFKRSLEDKTVIFSKKELLLLKPIIAQYLVHQQMASLAAYPLYSDANLDQNSRTKKRIIHSLNVAKILASCGSFNCEISNLVLCLAIRNKLSIPLELVNFSGVRDDGQDTQHTFVTLGSTDQNGNSLGKALLSKRCEKTLSKTEEEDFRNYIICDAHHQESYPLTQALSEANTKLARYDDINHEEVPVGRRFIRIENPAEWYNNDSEIRSLCDQIYSQKNLHNSDIKASVREHFHKILINPFAFGVEVTFNNSQKERALRVAATNGFPDYVELMYRELNVNLNAQDENSSKRKTALHLAIEKKQVNCLKILLHLVPRQISFSE